MTKLFVIDDDTKDEHFIHPNLGRGLDLSARGPGEYGYGSAATAFPEELIIPENEWQARIKEKEERQNRISDHLKLNGIGPKNQQQTNYCWANAPVMAMEIIRCLQGLKHISLSPSSVAAQIKNYRNEGGWGKEALQWISDKGVMPSSLWPDNAYNGRQYATNQNKEAALDYTAPEWWELKVRNKAQLISCLLRNIPVPIGLNWWGHEVCAVDAVWLNGTAEPLILNSWGPDWGEGGYGVLAGARGLPDDAVAPRTAIAA